MVLRPLLRRASKIVRALAWLALFLALPVGAQSSQAARSDSAAVASALHRFLTAFENLDWEPFRDSFSDSATVFHPAANLPKRVTGRGAIDSTSAPCSPTCALTQAAGRPFSASRPPTSASNPWRQVSYSPRSSSQRRTARAPYRRLPTRRRHVADRSSPRLQHRDAFSAVIGAYVIPNAGRRMR